MTSIRLPLKEEYVKSGYDAKNYDKFIEVRSREAKKEGQEVEIRDATDEEKRAGAAHVGAPVPPVVTPVPPSDKLRFPKSPAELKGTAQEAIIKNWAHQSKTGLITLCSVKQGAHACYYPLVPKRDAKRDNQPLEVTREGGRVGFAALCSYDPEGHGEQTIFPPKAEDEI